MKTLIDQAAIAIVESVYAGAISQRFSNPVRLLEALIIRHLQRPVPELCPE